ncbi:MAG: (2Fe-2S) ferredoxin domain-containing protein [Nitrospinota bacterium]|nr:(2Fe-2S) ferredoxin domain-containing protein [Nitrospinota bacterium]
MARFTKHLFFCINERATDNPKGCCYLKNSPDLLGHAKKRVHEMGLKGEVRVNKAGCLDACAHGPALVVYPDDVWYTPNTIEDVEEILQEHVKNGRIVQRLTIQFKKK